MILVTYQAQIFKLHNRPPKNMLVLHRAKNRTNTDQKVP